MASTKNRKAAALALAVVGVAGLSIASAAQLNVGTSSLGAGQEVVQSCQTETINIGFENEYATGGYQVENLVLSNLLGCADPALNYQIMLTGDGGVQLAELEGDGLTATTTISVPGAVAAEDVTGVAVVIYS